MRMLATMALTVAAAAAATAQEPVRTGSAAFGDWRSDAPGVRRLITPADLPPPDATASAANPPARVARSPATTPKAPLGFAVDLLASGLSAPRVVRTAPNGDVFVAESGTGRVLVLRVDGTTPAPAAPHVFAAGLPLVFGVAFAPPGPDPRWVYVATERSVVRFAYRSGDLAASGPAEAVVRDLPRGGFHWTRDLAFSADGRTLFVSVGSATNDAEGAARPSAAEVAAAPLGASFGEDRDRADVLAFDPDGKGRRVYATGLRNCSGLAVQPDGGAVWCVVNERDGLGDNLPPDFATRVEDGAFYGWPWFYIGAHEDPSHAGARPDLAGRIAMPDVLLQPHSAPLGIAFYPGGQFPADYRGDAFVALHGSWNRARRTGYKVVRLIMKDGRPTGEYEDFLTGFVASDSGVWGRPVGVAATRDGALLVTDDEGGAIWRVRWRGR
ncbi:glucose/arabinose dehydrogenase [Roseiarcus fermentans]|uniref:Glucose/arabinose dehydrogenase n=1 Tax=Roseiarcus fermentans TaxID=1473586 RepID=A0A366EI79_9HYPH|nr:PQQ-dependent sugar dehydrogenase [Roseiarcus fermentans]RBP02122.1 glucose/arabinose dehydrogenase [Roseiarcus fermentans]